MANLELVPQLFPEGLSMVRDQDHPGLYLSDPTDALTEDPEYPNLYQIGA